MRTLLTIYENKLVGFVVTAIPLTPVLSPNGGEGERKRIARRYVAGGLGLCREF
jgi:hypothetical protein